MKEYEQCRASEEVVKQANKRVDEAETKVKKMEDHLG